MKTSFELMMITICERILPNRLFCCYLRRLRVVGVTEAVGEEDDRDSGADAALIAIREVEEAPSEAEMSLFISSLLRRDTAREIGGNYLILFPLIRWQN